MLDKQEQLQEELNNQRAEIQGKVASPRKQDEIESQRHGLEALHNQKLSGTNTLKDLRRQIPSLAQEFGQQVELLSGNINLLIQNNSELQGEIICLLEEKKSQKLISTIEDEKTQAYEFQLTQLKQRAAQLDKELALQLERGDDQYSQLREEIKDQDEEEA